MTRRQQHGFTLIEVLVTLAVFGVLTVMSYQILGATFSNAALLGERMDRLQALQRTMRTIGDDFLQLAPRPIRDPFGQTTLGALQSQLGADFALELTRDGWSNRGGARRSTLQRVAYRIEEGELRRYHWQVLDRTLANQPQVQVMLTDVEDIAFRFLGTNGTWATQWPDVQSGLGTTPTDRPRAVEVRVTIADEGEVFRLIEGVP